MDKKRYETGLGIRKAVLGESYVENALRSADDFNREFQELVTEFAWGEVWGNDALDRKQHSILNLGILAALGRMHEFELHLRGALNNGCTLDEIKAALTQVAVYCGIPAGVECFRIARKVLAEREGTGA